MPDPHVLARNPAWLPWSIDPAARTITFVHAPVDVQRAATFLDAESLRTALGREPDSAVAPIAGVASAIAGAAPAPPLHFVFHGAFCCSTLMARALDLPGRCFTLKEPAVVNALASLAYAGRLDRATLDLVLALLARPLDGAVMLVKPSNEANVLAAPIMAARPHARALFMSSALEDFLASIADKGLWGRAWARRIFARDRGTPIDLAAGTADEDFGHTDLQIAGRYWLSQRALAHELARRFPHRLASLDADRLVAAPDHAVEAALRFFDIPAASEDVAASVARVFARHSKRGDAAYDPATRAKDRARRQAAHGDEAAMVATWIDTVAGHAGFDAALPNRLL